MKLKPNRKSNGSAHSSSILIPNGDFKANESYKAIRTNMLHLLKDVTSKTILITSPYANAGKTTTSANLAIAFAQLGKKVLLIDADMRKPTIHKLFSTHSTPGLSNIIAGKATKDVIKGTKYENLYILTAGSIPPNPSELLHSDVFTNLVAELSTEYETIFIDAPPVDAVTDAVIISQLTAGTVLVIRQNSTEKDALVRTVNSLKNVNANILGYVLNAVDYEKFSYKYGHYSGKYIYKYYSYYNSTGQGSEAAKEENAENKANETITE